VSKTKDAAVYATVTTIVTAIVLVIARNLLGIPINVTELLIVIVAV
jgi:hypothetical protein